MAEPASPLGPEWRPGRFGAPGVPGVALSESRPGSIVQLAVWPGMEAAGLEAIHGVCGLVLPAGPGGGAAAENASAFGFAPGRFLVVAEAEGMAEPLREALPQGTGVVTDLSHGRTAFRVDGPKAEWVLAKLFALDFAPAAFPVGAGRATAHHDVSALMQRTAALRFEVYVFRSFARAFWRTLRHASEEVGYEVA